MPSETTALTKSTHHEALPAPEAKRLAQALGESADATVFVDGTALRLSAGAAEAVMDLLARLGRGEAVTIATSELLLNTSQAAQLAGVSNTYMRKLTDAGTIPVEYRGSHRRIRPRDVQAWLDARAAAGHAGDTLVGDGAAAPSSGAVAP